MFLVIKGIRCCKGTSYKLAPAWVENRLEAAVGSALSKTITKSGYTKLLCNIKPE